MMKLLHIAIVAAILASTAATATAEDNTPVYNVPRNDPLMMEATRKAKAGLDGFLAKLAAPPPGTESYAVKIGIVDDGDSFRVVSDDSISGIEYFWLSNVIATGDGFRAEIDNSPELARNVRLGEEISFRKSDIFDWLYVDHGRMQGNYSACPALLTGPKEDLEAFERDYGVKCE